MTDAFAGLQVPGYLGRVLDGGGEAAGTCFQVVSGLVVTAWHVLDDLAAGNVGALVSVDPLGGGDRRGGDVVAVDELADLAVLRLDEPLRASIA